MTMLSGFVSSKILRVVCVLATAVVISSCKSTGSGPYAEGGGYNPYPGNNGMVQNGSQPAYSQAPPPPPPGYSEPAGQFQSQPTSKHSYSGKSKSKYGSSGSSSSKKKGTKASDGYVYSGGSVHTVVAGDTLYTIAEHNHTSVAKLKSLNHLKSGILRVGQKIKVR